ncbi:hypothetical protein LEP1GSC060_2044 [Leptospira weilii serovar Ranarum str. ICFT]|uniref:Uncharacterized protein n=1 Tax=Leptospira weilii serovar Ranarum str. ICFT TaxID=1218598 RepID=N1WN27_9LEPT|nr:hypothetical protein LEP1GSC060_2044 [Leptospira weilii serovar Ranarum str. ICFT]
MYELRKQIGTSERKKGQDKKAFLRFLQKRNSKNVDIHAAKNPNE